MSNLSLECTKREETGKGISRRLRRDGKIPGVVYGKDVKEPVRISLDKKHMEKFLKTNGLNYVIDLSIDGADNHVCMITDFQRDHLYRELTHIDFKQVRLDEPVIARVDVKLVGEAKVRSRGGIAQLFMPQIQVKALPNDIPTSITLDVTELKGGDRINLGDVALPDSASIVDDPRMPVVTIITPRSMAVATEDEEEGEDGEEAASGGEGEGEGES